MMREVKMKRFKRLKMMKYDHGVEPVAEGFRIFESEEFGQVRVVVGPDGEPWFVASDVAKVLGYSHTPHMTRYLDEDEAAVHNMDIRSKDGTVQSRQVTIINESGLYTSVIHSRKPEAKRFKKYVTADILPSIRKHGVYATHDFVEQALADPATMIRTLEALQKEREARRIAEATKQWINNKKTATAMGRLGGVTRDRDRLKRENERLKGQVIAFPENPTDHEARNYKQVKAIDWLKKYLEMSRPAAYSTVGKALTQLSEDMGIPYRRLEDSRFGQVNMYHTDVIEEFRILLKTDHTYLLRAAWKGDESRDLEKAKRYINWLDEDV
jgi:prophage antirepressor-like protein